MDGGVWGGDWHTGRKNHGLVQVKSWAGAGKITGWCRYRKIMGRYRQKSWAGTDKNHGLIQVKSWAGTGKTMGRYR
jgi:hypothetical protein